VKLAVLSDSHVGQRIHKFPSTVLRKISHLDGIIHCGDYVDLNTVNILEEFGNFRGVYGNMDDVEVTHILPETLKFEIEDVRIGLYHGWGSPIALSKKVLRRLSETYPNYNFDVIFFGHSHRPSDVVIGNVRMINPGAISGNIFSKKGTWGIIEIENRNIKWNLIEINPSK